MNENNFCGVLISGCIGDVLGSYNENLSFSEIRNKKRITKDFNPTGGVFRAQFTDDTELTIILAQYLLNYHGDKNHSMVQKVHSMYQKVVKCSKRGYSKKTRLLLTNWNDCMPGNDSDTNGSVMRIAPLALVKINDDKELFNKIKYAIYCTHGESKDSVDTSFLHVKLIKYLLSQKCNNADNFYEYMLSVAKTLTNLNLYPLLVLINPNNKKTIFASEDNDQRNFLNINVTKNIFGHDFMQIKAIHCYTLVLVCFLYNFNNPENALIMAANIGGDTDTIAKIVGDLIGAKYGTSWIPEKWKQFEHYEDIIKLGKDLWKKHNS